MPGDPDAGNSCVTGLEQASLGDKGRDGFDYAHTENTTPIGASQPSYLILVRAIGGRNTVTYTETIVRK